MIVYRSITMHFRNAICPTHEELLEWAAEPESPEPVPDWDLVLAWSMERGLLRLCIDLAADAHSSKARFFRMVLYQWVAVVARNDQFETLRPIFNQWMDVARGVENPAVKRWRHQALLIFQGVELFEWNRWWKGFADEQRPDPNG
jgi:hypothetical protein